MTIVVNKTSSREELDEALLKLTKKRKKINLDKYFGKIKFSIDGLEYQKKVRDEWD